MADFTPPPHRLGTSSAYWLYRDPAGDISMASVRFDTQQGKQVLPCTPDGKGGWQWKALPEPRPLYGLDRLAAKPTAPVIVTEGEKAADAAQRLFPDSVATTSSGGANAAGKTDWTLLAGRDVTIWPDNDEPGRNYAADVARLCCAAGAASVRVVNVPKDWPDGWDLADPPPEGVTPYTLRQMLEEAQESEGKAEDNRLGTFEPIELLNFLCLNFPPRELLLSPVLTAKGLAMLYAQRGIGKTFMALHMAYAVACGGRCMGWTAAKPRRVLYIDGEMPAISLQERLIKVAASYNNASPPTGHFRILAADMLENGMPDLANPESWDALWPHVQDVDLVVLDNLSTLCRNGRENEAESWAPVQESLLRLRRQGVSVLLVHHAAKGGQQRGTSKREDVLDTVIALRRPANYQPQDGARFEVHIEKARGFHGDEAAPFEATLREVDGKHEWLLMTMENARLEQAKSLFEQGLSVRDVAEEMKISRSAAGRYRKQLGIGGKDA